MTNILFIYGYGGSPESTFCKLIREALPVEHYNVICHEYPQDDCAKARDFLHEVIERESIDIVVGTSLGGFITLSLDCRQPKVAINPCMVPSVELPRLKPRPDHPEDKTPSAEFVDSYKPFENDVISGKKNRSVKVIGLFGRDDELLGTKYKQTFENVYGTAFFMPGGHHGNAAAIPQIVKAIESMSNI